ncbi:MAG: hypothetical protein PHX87_02210 [Candidatus Peribacteraceae bacterium]|nr:hypothetical protein [Candidatus Peribacteraceae bacterium]MDD5742221.1 hypothetical protein [Candidatus Peribacteraceae bacterium]
MPISRSATGGFSDAVLFLDVLEHVQDDFALVSQLLAGMKPGAYLFIAAPGDPKLWGPHDRGFEHERRYSLPRFRMLWEGLPVEEERQALLSRRECVCTAPARITGNYPPHAACFSSFRSPAVDVRAAVRR